MATMAGKDGTIKLGENTVGYIDNFSINVNQGSAETSQIGKPWKEFINASRDWSGSLSGSLDYADAAQKEIVDNMLQNVDEKYTCEFKVNATLTLTGDMIITSVSITGSHGDKVAVSINFQGTGALAAKEVA